MLTSGAGGAGEADSAITFRRFASSAVPPTSGAAPVESARVRARATAADIGFIGICGCGFTTAEEAMFSGPGFFSWFATSGAATSVVVRCCIFGADALGENSSRGFGMAGAAAHWTIFGNAGSIFGGVGGASG